MNAKFEIKNPDAVEMTMTVTMSLRCWKVIRESMGISTMPEIEFRREIDDLVMQATKVFCPKVSRSED